MASASIASSHQQSYLHHFCMQSAPFFLNIKPSINGSDAKKLTSNMDDKRAIYLV
jgi:hypothetical protein